MTLPDFSPVFPDEQAAMTEALSSIGIDVTYQPITGDQVVGSIMGGQWPINFFALTSAIAVRSMAQADPAPRSRRSTRSRPTTRR